MSKYVESNITRGEEVVAMAQKNKARLILAWVWGILGCWLLFIPTFKAIKATIIYRNLELGITTKRVIGKAGWLNTGSLDAPLNKIQNASVVQNFWGKIFNFATIKIDTAADSITFTGIKDADAFKRTLMAQIDQYEADKLKAQAEQMAASMGAAIRVNRDDNNA